MRPYIPFTVQPVIEEETSQEAALAWIMRWLEQRRQFLSEDKSRYAQKRLRMWLRIEPPLGPTQPFRPGVETSDEVWAALQRLIKWEFDYCLVTWSEAVHHIGITPHGDAAYADWEAKGLNVQGTAQFNYWEDWGLLRTHQPPTTTLTLYPGDLVTFNCKNPHSALPFGEVDRVNINFWKKKVLTR